MEVKCGCEVLVRTSMPRYGVRSMVFKWFMSLDHCSERLRVRTGTVSRLEPHSVFEFLDLPHQRTKNLKATSDFMTIQTYLVVPGS